MPTSPFLPDLAGSELTAWNQFRGISAGLRFGDNGTNAAISFQWNMATAAVARTATTGVYLVTLNRVFDNIGSGPTSYSPFLVSASITHLDPTYAVVPGTTVNVRIVSQSQLEVAVYDLAVPTKVWLTNAATTPVHFVDLLMVGKRNDAAKFVPAVGILNDTVQG